MNDAGTRVLMVRPNLNDLPDYSLPDGITAHWYTPGDGRQWVAIQQDAETHIDINDQTFVDQFHEDEEALKQRMCFLFDENNKPIATASAWYDDYFHEADAGRIHWVAMVQSAQGHGLAKPLLSIVCDQLRKLGHQRAYLFTATGRVPAINLYLKYGFVPEYQDEEQRAAWEAIYPQLKYAPPK